MSVIKESRSDRIFNIVNVTIMILILIIELYPLIFVVSASISNPDLVNRGEVWLLPKDISFEGYVRVFRDKEIWTGYRNTIFYTVFGTIINLFVTLPAAYSLSRKDFYGRIFFTAIFTFTMFFSGGLIPTYLIIKGLRLRDTIWALLLPGAASMYNIIVTRTFFQTNIPNELREAAEIDGCSNTRLFLTIVLPLSTPIIAVMALFYGVGHWNSYFSALIYLSRRELYPLQLFLREILILNEMSTEMLMNATGEEIEALAKQARIADMIKYAIIIVSSAPVLMAYPFIQKYFVKGIMIGAIKG
ncbi:MAG TPA: carbohydrate ABC transporter permease [Clostridiaceae bacterium]|nr:carbohydrate ABC transporter permease [Clostridiaceae bacterium]